jgi:hypothetical protein
MEYLDALEKTWGHRDLGDAKRDYVGLVQYATLAASSHNTQPWKFKLRPGRVTILPDLERCCPEVDPDEHHLYASLGCAAENLLLAAQAAGLAGHPCYDPALSSLAVELEPAAPRRSPLFDAIPRRQCSRTEYDGARLSADSLRLLADAARGDGVSLVFLTEPKQKEQVAEYVAAGNTAQFANVHWAREVKKWIRFNARDAARTGDGLLGAALGIPQRPPLVGRSLHERGRLRKGPEPQGHHAHPKLGRHRCRVFRGQ